MENENIQLLMAGLTDGKIAVIRISSIITIHP